MLHACTKKIEQLHEEEKEVERRADELVSEEEGWRQRIEKQKSIHASVLSEFQRQKEAVEKERKKLVEQSRELVEESQTLVQKILKDAEDSRLLLFGEVEGLRKEKEKLEAEEALLKTAVKMRVKEFREARERLQEEEAGRETGEDARPVGNLGPVGNLLSRLPTLPPLEVQKEISS